MYVYSQDYLGHSLTAQSIPLRLEKVSTFDTFYSISAPSCLLVRLLLYLFPVVDLLDCRVTRRGQSRISIPFSSFAPFWAVYISGLPALCLIHWIVLHHEHLPAFASRHSVLQPNYQLHSDNLQVKGEGPVELSTYSLQEAQAIGSPTWSSCWTCQTCRTCQTCQTCRTCRTCQIPSFLFNQTFKLQDFSDS